jgi:VanZ family protein
VALAVGASRWWQAALLALIGVVGYLAFTPTPPPQADLGWDKLNHAIAFTALTISGSFGFPRPRQALLYVMGAMLAFGGLIEIVQAFVPGRSCDWEDVLADSIGILSGTAITLALRRLAHVGATD